MPRLSRLSSVLGVCILGAWVLGAASPCPACPFAHAQAIARGASADFDQNFTGQVLRLDLHHTGAAGAEIYAADQLRIEGAWPGPREGLATSLGLGKFRFDVWDEESGARLVSQGYSSIFGEWETTAEARAGTARTFEEAIRFPEPRGPFVVTLSRRDDAMQFREIFRQRFDPRDPSVLRAKVADHEVLVILDSGDPATKLDLLFLGDGYTAEEQGLFKEDVTRLCDALFQVEPFRARKDAFNVRAIAPAAHESGVTHPRRGRFTRSPLGISYNTFGSDRYALTTRDRAWRDVAAATPYDAVVMLMNSEKYGGGGIYQLYSTAAAHSGEAPYLVIHEFGHHLAGLGDEYYTSSVAYEDFQPLEVEPWEPNVTALLDPDQLKWRDLLTTGVPLPTPWGKEAYEGLSGEFQERRNALRSGGAAERELEALFLEERRETLLVLGERAGEVGAFEGAMYEARGLYRPAIDCLMFSRNDVGFCPVCDRAIQRVIDRHAGRRS